MQTNPSPEISVLLMACAVELSEEKKVQLTQFIDQHPLNWKRLYTLAIRHRVTPFLYRTLQGLPNIPESFLATLQNDCRAIATDNLLKLHQYKLLAKQLADNSIDHIALKGIYLAANCYPESSLRSIGDLDVLVAKEDVFTCMRLLRTDGYLLDPKSTLYMKQKEQLMLADLYEISLVKPFFNDSYFDLDLHWKFICFNDHYKVYDLREILSRPELSIEFQIVLLVTHHGVTGVWQTINYINDLYFLMHDQKIDWPWLLEEIHSTDLERVFLVGLSWCQQIWGLQLPASVQEMLAEKAINTLANEYAKNWETNEPIVSSKLIFAQLRFFLKAQTQLSKQIKAVFTFFTSRLFQYSTFRIGKRIVYIPQELGIITVFIRAIRSLLRFIPAPREPLR